MLFPADHLQQDTATFAAAAGGSIRVQTRINRQAIQATGLELSDLSIKARIVDADTYAPVAAPVPVALTGVSGANESWVKGTLTIAAAELAAGDYQVEVYLAADIEPTASARAKGAPATIDHTEIAPIFGTWLAVT